MNAKIIVNVGERSANYELLKEMALAGMDIARLNFSHATKKQLVELKENLSKIKEETGKDIKILQDLCGPRIRVGMLPYDINMKKGEVYSFSYNHCNLKENCIPIDYQSLANDIEIKHPFFLANGAIKMEVEKIQDDAIIARVITGGKLSSKKGINVPKTNLKEGGLTKKDQDDAEFGAKQEVDYIAMSFVQTADDVKKLRKIVGSKIKIISKIERATALNAIDEIIKESDGIMVARGDLGVETPVEELPLLQKDLIRHAHWHKKPAIVATQMMLSMIDKPYPTYAEVTDVANAVLDGADALMLSDETSVGNYPIECIKIMKKIIDKCYEFKYAKYWK